MTKPEITLLLATPRGFCAGVERAIAIVEKALHHYGAPVYVRHEIVHNKYVLDDLRGKGAVFVKDLHEVPEGAPVVFSAHGVPKVVPAAARARAMLFVDATCPLVSKVHREAENLHKAGFTVLLIGHAGHPEVVGTMGQLPEGAMRLIETVDDVQSLPYTADDKLAYVTQTTLSADDTAHMIEALRQRYPQVAAPRKEDICYATTNRQTAVKELVAQGAEMLVVLGSQNSSNSRRLAEVAKAAGMAKAFLIDNAADLPWDALQGVTKLGITAGASAPEVLVQGVLEALRQRFTVTVQDMDGEKEDVYFRLPPFPQRKVSSR